MAVNTHKDTPMNDSAAAIQEAREALRWVKHNLELYVNKFGKEDLGVDVGHNMLNLVRYSLAMLDEGSKEE